MKYRRKAAFNKRQEANELATNRPHPKHKSNGDEHKFRHESVNKNQYENEKDLKKKAVLKKKVELKNKPSYLMSFTKGMPHNESTGLLNDPDNYPAFVKAIDSGDPRDFRDVPLGHKNHVSDNPCAYPDINPYSNLKPEELVDDSGNVIIDYGLTWKSEKVNKLNAELLTKKGEKIKLRAWESQSAGNAFELEGPDAQAVTMPPAPKLGSAELTAEMAEVYAQALLRDVPFTAFNKGVASPKKFVPLKGVTYNNALEALQTNLSDVNKVEALTEKLNHFDWFTGKNLGPLSRSEIERGRAFVQNPENAFRGITNGDNVGPYISQFLLAGTNEINRINADKDRSPKEGLIKYGAINVDQKVRKAVEGVDYMTEWNEWLDVQNGADLIGFEEYDQTQKRRFIYSPRDLATYVHFDALYEAYLNACLIMLSNKVPFDTGIPYQQSDNIDHQQGFAHFGGPHILSLVTEVATRALKAVRFQKFNVHRRCRPEVLAARVHKNEQLQNSVPELKTTVDALAKSGILSEVGKANKVNNANNINNNYLLPMAFCEGSPMHPAYGAGHATVAGACVTILKAFFDHKQPLEIVPVDEASPKVQKLIKHLGHKSDIHSANLAYVAANNGETLEAVPVLDENCKLAKLTVEGELNKLASNISIGRNWAGVHYFTDYYESLLMGEQIAIGILEEQKLMFNENFSMTVPLFGGDTIRI